MGKVKLRTDCSKMNDRSYSGAMKKMTASMRKHSTIKEPYPACCASLDEADTAIAEFDTAIVEADGGSDVAKEKKKAARKRVKAITTPMIDYFTLAANGDREALIATGVELVNDGPKNTSRQTGRPVLRVKHGNRKGMAICRMSYNRRAGSVEVHVSTGNPHDEASWAMAAISTKCSHIELFNLESGKDHCFRGRYHTSDGPSEWSDFCTLMPL